MQIFKFLAWLTLAYGATANAESSNICVAKAQFAYRVMAVYQAGATQPELLGTLHMFGSIAQDIIARATEWPRFRSVDQQELASQQFRGVVMRVCSREIEEMATNDAR